MLDLSFFVFLFATSYASAELIQHEMISKAITIAQVAFSKEKQGELIDDDECFEKEILQLLPHFSSDHDFQTTLEGCLITGGKQPTSIESDFYFAYTKMLRDIMNYYEDED